MGIHHDQPQGQISAEQMEQLREIQAEYGQSISEKRSELYDKQWQLGIQMAGEEVDAGEVRSLVREINDLRGDMLSARMDMYLQMHEQDLLPTYERFGMRGGHGMGPGMMRGMYPGMMQGMCPEMMQGMSPMMQGMGPGMMHGPGMGPGMMHGPGMGQGW